jgi:hypothetical protein
MVPRERVQIGLWMAGICLVAFGIIQLDVFRSDDPHQPTYKKGAYAEALASGALARYSPWMIVGGMISLGAAWLIRER